MSSPTAPVALSRACRATTVPAGEGILLPQGAEVRVVQQLGGSITVRTGRGELLRIEADDADALGQPPATDEPAAGSSRTSDGQPAADVPQAFDLQQVVDALDQVYDPEIPVSIVELGLVYRCEEVAGPLGTRRIEVDMSMTAPGCGMGDVLRADAARAVLDVPGVDDAEVNLVWDPPWTIDRISEAARLELGLL